MAARLEGGVGGKGWLGGSQWRGAKKEKTNWPKVSDAKELLPSRSAEMKDKVLVSQA